MYYYNPTVKQCLDRKGKPWRASIDYKDPITGKRKQKTKMLPGAKGKKEAKKMAEEWLAEMNDSVKTMAPVEQGKTLEEMIEGFENYRLTVGEIEKSTHQKNLAVSKNYIYGDANPDAMKTATEKLALRFNDDSNLAPDDDLADRLNAIEENLNRKI